MKSNGTRWRHYIKEAEHIKALEAFLADPISAGSYLGLAKTNIPLEILESDTDFDMPPTTEWYAIHLGVRDKRKWSQQLISWGLNRFSLDLHTLQKGFISYTMEARRQAKNQSKSFSLAELTREDMSVKFRRAYESTSEKFVGTSVPSHWYLDAEGIFIECCKGSAVGMLERGFYDKDTSQLTKSGEQNWDDLYMARISLEHSFRSSLAVVRKQDNQPPQKDCPPCLKCMPSEMIDNILGHALEADSSGSKSEDIPGLLIANKFLREHSLSWLSRQVITIRARSWPRNPNRKFDQNILPVEWLQTLRKVRIDFEGVRYSDRLDDHPVMEQIAEVWKTRNALESLTLTIHPDFDKLKLGELTHGPWVETIYRPILQIPELRNKLDYAYDFGAPVGYNNLPVLHMIFEWTHYSEQALQFILRHSKDFINQQDTSGKTPLHKAVNRKLNSAVQMLLRVEGIDVNLPDSKGDTPFDCALGFENYSIASDMLEHKNLDVTQVTIRREIRYGQAHPLIAKLCLRHGSVPRFAQRFLSRTQIGELLKNNCKLQ
jgi:hypothetical protein